MRTHSRVLVLVTVVAPLLSACSGGGGGGGGGGPYASCAGGSCASGFVCDPPSLLCVPDAACAPASCAGGLQCDPYSERCTSQPFCLGDGDCQAGWACSGYRCTQLGPGSCTTHAECAPGTLCRSSTHTCETTIACPYDGCPGGWECVSGSCRPLAPGTCKRDVDCPAGAACLTGACVGCASSGAACTAAYAWCDAAANLCRTCRDAGDCPAGLVCTPSGCAECGSSADCPPGRSHCVVPSVWYTPELAGGSCNECGGTYGCGGGYDCAHGSVCSPDSIYGCTSDGDCAAYPATPRCGVLGRCLRCTSDAHCPAEHVCRMGDCHRVPHGDVCKDPIDLPLSGARTELIAALGGFDCELGPIGSCVGADAFYRFTLGAETKLDIDVHAESWSATPSLHLYTDGCAGGVAFERLSSARTVTRYLPPGTYVLRFDGARDVRYTIAIRATPVALPEGNSCVTPRLLVPDAAGAATATGDTTGLLDVSGSSCDRTNGGPQAVYAIDLAAPAYVSLQARPLVSTFALDLDVKQGCAAAADRTYTCQTWGGKTVTQEFAPMPAGRSYVVVDSVQAAGPFQLDAFVNPVPWARNDDCADAEPLAFAGGVASASGTTADRAALPSVSFCPPPSCGAPNGTCDATAVSGNDVFYRFSTRDLGDRKLEITLAGDGTFLPAFAVETQCRMGQGQTACGLAPDASGAAAATVDVLPPNDYLVHVSGKPLPGCSGTGCARGGAFTLSVTLAEPAYPPMPNDACGSLATLAPSGTSAPYAYAASGDTRGVVHDASASCGGGGGKDVVYALALPAGASRGRFDVSLDSTLSTYTPVAYAEAAGACGGDPVAAALACAAAATGGGVAQASFLATGAPRVWVDGASGTAGPFALSASFTPAPYNDACAGATDTGLGVSASLAAAFDDGACPAVAGADAYYTVTIPSGPKRTARIDLVPTGFTGGIAWYGLGCGAECTTSAAGASAGSAVRLDVPNLASGTYVFAVTSVDGLRGSYQLTTTSF